VARRQLLRLGSCSTTCTIWMTTSLCKCRQLSICCALPFLSQHICCVIDCPAASAAGVVGCTYYNMHRGEQHCCPAHIQYMHATLCTVEAVGKLYKCMFSSPTKHACVSSAGGTTTR
jgi:hypothetical protein